MLCSFGVCCCVGCNLVVLCMVGCVRLTCSVTFSYCNMYV